MALDEAQARSVLAQQVTRHLTDELIRRTHGQPPPSYLLIYNDMAQDSLQFSFVGNWDFRKIEAINKDEALQKKVPQHGSKEYVPFLWKMAGGPPRYTDLLVPVAEKGRAIIFENNILIDRDAMTSTVNSVRYGRGVPRHLFYDQGDEFIEKDLPNATLPILHSSHHWPMKPRKGVQLWCWRKKDTTFVPGRWSRKPRMTSLCRLRHSRG